MKSVLNFFRTTLVGGILFLVPVVVLVIVLGKALVLVDKIAEPLAQRLPVHSVIGLKAPVFLAILLLVLFSFVAGIIAKTALARSAHAKLEKSVLANVPGYSVIKLMGESLLGVQTEHSQPVVFVHFDDHWQLGFLVERLDDGLMTVHIPDASSPQSGNVIFVAADRVILTKISSHSALKVLRGFGHGSKALLGGHLSALKPAVPHDPLAPRSSSHR